MIRWRARINYRSWEPSGIISSDHLKIPTSVAADTVVRIPTLEHHLGVKGQRSVHRSLQHLYAARRSSTEVGILGRAPKDRICSLCVKRSLRERNATLFRSLVDLNMVDLQQIAYSCICPSFVSAYKIWLPVWFPSAVVKLYLVPCTKGVHAFITFIFACAYITYSNWGHQDHQEHTRFCHHVHSAHENVAAN